MAASRSVLPVAQRRSDLLMAGLTWHALFETDLRERERKVAEFTQSSGIDRMCVLESTHGLQIGYCQRGSLPVAGMAKPRLISFVLAVKKYFSTDHLLLVWKIQTDEVQAQYAVILFEDGLLVLDYITPANAVEDVITTYLESVAADAPIQRMTNDVELFPEFMDISALDWFAESLDSARLRPPRKPRLIDPVKRPVQALMFFGVLSAVCVALAWYVWTGFIAKPKPVAVKPKVTPEQTYMRTLIEAIPELGWSGNTVHDVIMDMMQLPLSREGWQLRQAVCTLQNCRYTWLGLEGADPRVLADSGKEIKRTISQREGRIELERTYSYPQTGVPSLESMRSKEDASLFCRRETVILRELKIRASLGCQGTVWPESAPRILDDLMVNRYSFSVTGDWVTIDRLLERYSDAIYWKEIKLFVEPGRTDLLDVLQFELSGDLYGYR